MAEQQESSDTLLTQRVQPEQKMLSKVVSKVKEGLGRCLYINGISTISLLLATVCIVLKYFAAAKLIQLYPYEDILLQIMTIIPVGTVILILISVEAATLILLWYALIRQSIPLRRAMIYALYFIMAAAFLLVSLYLTFQISMEPVSMAELNSRHQQYGQNYGSYSRDWERLVQAHSDCCDISGPTARVVTCPRMRELRFQAHSQCVIDLTDRYRLSSVTALSGLILLYFISLMLHLMFVSRLHRPLALCTALDLWNYLCAGILILAFGFFLGKNESPTQLIVRQSAHTADMVGWIIVGSVMLLHLVGVLIFALIAGPVKLTFLVFSPIPVLSFLALLGGLVRLGIEWNEHFVHSEYLEYLNVNFAAPGHEAYTNAWNIVQRIYSCCGLFGPEDYANMTNRISESTSLPASCCHLNSTSTCSLFPNAGTEGVFLDGCLEMIPRFAEHARFRILIILLFACVFNLLTFLRSALYEHKYNLAMTLMLHSCVVILLVTVGVVTLEYVKPVPVAAQVFGSSGISLIVSGCLTGLQLVLLGVALYCLRSRLKRMSIMAPFVMCIILLIVSSLALSRYYRGIRKFYITPWQTEFWQIRQSDISLRRQFEVYETAAFWQVVACFFSFGLSLIYASLWHECMSKRAL